MRTIPLALAIATALLATACARAGGRDRVQPLLNAQTAPDTAEAKRIDEISRLWRDGLYDRAAAALDRLLAEGSAHPEALLLKARLLLQAGDTEAALPWLDRAAAASPLWPEPRILLAQAYLTLERFAAAESVFADIERIAPKGPWGPYGLAAVAARRGDDARAAQEVARALERDPDHQPSLVLAAALARKAGNAGREEALITRLLANDPDQDEAWARLGELAADAGRREDAQRACLRAWALSPRPATARALADLAQARGDEAEAARWRQRAGLPAPTPTLTPGPAQ